MIKINEQFEIRPYLTYGGWEMTEYYPGQDKDGQPATRKRKTYHATIQQACKTAINRCAAGCESLEELMELLDSATTVLADAVTLKQA